MLCCTEYSHSVSDCGVQNFCIQFVPDMFHFVLISQSCHFHLYRSSAEIAILMTNNVQFKKTKYELDFHFMVTLESFISKNLRACNSRLPPSIVVWMRKTTIALSDPKKLSFEIFSGNIL